LDLTKWRKRYRLIDIVPISAAEKNPDNRIKATTKTNQTPTEIFNQSLLSKDEVKPLSA
jgi:hypothetical protein